MPLRSFVHKWANSKFFYTHYYPFSTNYCFQWVVIVFCCKLKPSRTLTIVTIIWLEAPTKVFFVLPSLSHKKNTKESVEWLHTNCQSFPPHLADLAIAANLVRHVILYSRVEHQLQQIDRFKKEIISKAKLDRRNDCSPMCYIHTLCSH